MNITPTLRPFTDADLPIFKEWLSQPRVSRWFTPESWLKELSDKSGRFDFISKFVILDGETMVGFCQYYRCKEGGEAEYSMYPAETTYSLDYLIGDERYLGKGWAKATVKELLSRIGEIPEARLVVVQPEPENDRSRGLLKACGFELDKVNDVFVKAAK